MDNNQIKAVTQSPEFKQLVVKRWVWSLALTAIMLFVYFGFTLLLAFDKAVLAQRIGEHVTLGIPVGVGVIVLAWLLTGLYVWWANRYYDPMVERITRQLTDGKGGSH